MRKSLRNIKIQKLIRRPLLPKIEPVRNISRENYMIAQNVAAYTIDELIRSYRKIPTNGTKSPLIDWKSNIKMSKYMTANQGILSELKEELFEETDTERTLRKNQGNSGSIFSQKDFDDFLDTNIVRKDLLNVSEGERQKIRSSAALLISCFKPYEGDVASIFAIAVQQSSLGLYLNDFRVYYQQNKGNLDRLGEYKKQFRNTEAVMSLESFILFCYRKLEYDLVII